MAMPRVVSLCISLTNIEKHTLGMYKGLEAASLNYKCGETTNWIAFVLIAYNLPVLDLTCCILEVLQALSQIEPTVYWMFACNVPDSRNTCSVHYNRKLSICQCNRSDSTSGFLSCTYLMSFRHTGGSC